MKSEMAKPSMSVIVAPQPAEAVPVPVPPVYKGWGEVGYGDCCEHDKLFPEGTPKRVMTPGKYPLL